MKFHTLLGLSALFFIVFLITLSHFLGKSSRSYTFNFSQSFNLPENNIFDTNSEGLKVVVDRALNDSQAKENGVYGLYVEDLASGEHFTLNGRETFPSASLYKLVLMAAVLKEAEEGSLTLDDQVYGTKTHLSAVLGGLDYGYEHSPENLRYTINEALVRVGSISDNFAAIMLSEKLRQVRESRSENHRLLINMTKELGMNQTDFTADPIITTPGDIAAFFRLLYQGKVVSKEVSDQIIKLLSGSKLNNRIPAKLPDEVKVAHKTGELPRIRHDAGIVFLEGNPYLIVLMSKDLKYEDSGIEILAEISKEVYGYFKKKTPRLSPVE